jgi:hypothetical protein
MRCKLLICIDLQFATGGWWQRHWCRVRRIRTRWRCQALAVGAKWCTALLYDLAPLAGLRGPHSNGELVRQLAIDN